MRGHGNDRRQNCPTATGSRGRRSAHTQGSDAPDRDEPFLADIADWLYLATVAAHFSTYLAGS
jgi:hypothetical protein